MEKSILVTVVVAAIVLIGIVSACLISGAAPQDRAGVVRELFGSWVNSAVGVLIAWYTWETLRLRRAAERQLVLLEEQSRKALVPHLHLEPSGRNLNVERHLEVTNCTDRVALTVTPFLRIPDGTSLRWYFQSHNVPFDLPRKGDENRANKGMQEEPSGVTHLANRYEIDGPLLTQKLDEVSGVGTGHKSVAGVLFCDVGANLYLTWAALRPDNSNQLEATRTIPIPRNVRSIGSG